MVTWIFKCHLITLVSEYHMDNYLKEILAFVYYGLIVNNQPEKLLLCHICIEQRHNPDAWVIHHKNTPI